MMGIFFLGMVVLQLVQMKFVVIVLLTLGRYVMMETLWLAYQILVVQMIVLGLMEFVVTVYLSVVRSVMMVTVLIVICVMLVL